MIRKILATLLGLALLVGAFFGAKILIDSNVQTVREVPPSIKTVYAEPVVNTEVPIVVNANGNLVAAKKVELFAEVQGIFRNAGKPFKAGQRYEKGEVLMRIDREEFYTSLLAQRSTLYDLITSMMPDLKFDYPESFEHWEVYLNDFDINENIQPLPEPISDNERYFVNGRQVVTTYYNIKNLEERLVKYEIIAPFDGILTETAINGGTLIRSAQKLGEFVSLGQFELEVNVNQQYLDILKIGEPVLLTDLSGNREWQGVVKRINGRLDQATQTVRVFIAVSGKELIEGMYMEAHIAARSEQNALEIPRTLLINEKELFVVEDGKLVIKQIETVYYTNKTAVIKGLEDGTMMLNRNVPGAYSGMEVRIAESSRRLEQ